MNGCRADPGHARKLVTPLEAPASHTLSVVLGVGSGIGPVNARPMGVNGRAGQGLPCPAPFPYPLLRPSAGSSCSSRRAFHPYSCSISSVCWDRDPPSDRCQRQQAKCLGDSAEREGDSGREAKLKELVRAWGTQLKGKVIPAGRPNSKSWSVSINFGVTPCHTLETNMRR